MSTSVPPRDGGAVPGSPGNVSSVLNDELTLRRVFDREYPACLESARTQLGDAASQAPRVVQTAFVNAWNQRASFKTDEQLKAFLAEQVSHGASRALSRRAAAHRFGTKGGREEVQAASHATSATADAEQSWNEIAKTIHGEATSKDAHAAAATAGRHEAAEHMKSVAKTGGWKVPVAIGVAALAVMALGFFYLDKLGEGEAAVSAVNSAALQPIAASQTGQIGSTTLSDGTKVKLGPETKLYIPDEFPAKLRAVRVEGTASFDVASNPKLPFYVVMKKSQVIATGTSFIVSGFTDDSSFSVLVREGTVTVKTDKQSKSLAANEGAVVKSGAIDALADGQKTETFGWVDGKITVDNKPLREVVASLVRWFNLDIKVPDAKLLDRPASFAVSLDSSRAAISQIEKSGNVKFAYEGETKVFRDAPVKAEKPGKAEKKK